MAEDLQLAEKDHHKQQSFCKTRPAYRQGRNLTAVKVYTVNSESQHLCIYGVPQINLRNELKSLCTKYGKLNSIHVVTDHPTEKFTECYHVQFERIQSARIAKRLLDNRSFYGGVLHVCYAPEYESVDETGKKLQQRVKDVMNRLCDDTQILKNINGTEVTFEEYSKITKSQIKKKRKASDNFEESCSSNTKNKRYKGNT